MFGKKNGGCNRLTGSFTEGGCRDSWREFSPLKKMVSYSEDKHFTAVVIVKIWGGKGERDEVKCI